MQDENGKEMTEEQLLDEAAQIMGDVCCFLFETESAEGHAAAFMADCLLKYLQVAKRGDNVLSAAADYTAYEQEVYNRKLAQKSA